MNAKETNEAAIAAEWGYIERNIKAAVDAGESHVVLPGFRDMRMYKRNLMRLRYGGFTISVVGRWWWKRIKISWEGAK